jgi:uncharacterized membrane protein
MSYSDNKLEVLISITLRSGVLAAGTLGLIGGIFFFASHPQLADFRVFQGAATPFTSPGAILRQAFGLQTETLQLRGLSIVQTGIMLLLMTPVIRVAFSIFGFALEKDRVYVLITSIVLLTLTVSICLH